MNLYIYNLYQIKHFILRQPYRILPECMCYVVDNLL